MIKAEFDEERSFGIEIEFFGVDKNVLIEQLIEKGVNTRWEGYTHETTSHWKIVTDSSISHQGVEIVSPILKGRDGINELKTVCETLDRLGAKVDKSCGLHIHHDASDFTVKTFKNLFAYYVKYETTIDSLFPASRRSDNNVFCKSLRYYNFNDIEGTLDIIRHAKNIDSLLSLFNSRYIKLNLQSYLRHGTIEFRQHSGTIDFEKIFNWLLLTQVMIEKAVKAKSQTWKYDEKLDNWYSFRRNFCIYKSWGGSEEVDSMGKWYTKRIKELAG